MAFMFYDNPLTTIQYFMESEDVWIAPRAWVRTREAIENLAGDAYSANLYSVFSPDFEDPIETIWIVDSEYGFRMASDNEIWYLDKYLAEFG